MPPLNDPKTNDRTFFEERITSLLDGLYGAALRLAKNREDAEDLVAESVTKAWSCRESLNDRNLFKPWIFRILTNLFISRCRERSRKPLSLPLEDENDEAEILFSIFEKLHQPFLLWWNNPEKEFFNKMLRRDLEKAIDSLPECYRVVIVLAEMEGFSYQEISKILHLPVGTIRSRLARARGLLQKTLWEYGQDTGLIRTVGHKPSPSTEESHEAREDHRM